MIPIRFHTSSLRRGIMLLETLVYLAVWTLLAVMTMRALGDSRALRANGRDRAAMTWIAQTELDRIRQTPLKQLTAGVSTRTDRAWPQGVSATVELSRRDDGFWTIRVEVRRASVEGKLPVQLTTIHPGGRK
jgi:Tfp pilus assembly protein PilX